VAFAIGGAILIVAVALIIVLIIRYRSDKHNDFLSRVSVQCMHSAILFY